MKYIILLLISLILLLNQLIIINAVPMKLTQSRNKKKKNKSNNNNNNNNCSIESRMIWSDCPTPKECERKCIKPGEPEIVCGFVCEKPGCSCPQDKPFLHTNGTCISECVKDEFENNNCIGGQEYTTCGSYCEKTCQNRKEDIVCIALCYEGCRCPKDLIWDEITKTCVSEQDCEIMYGL